MLARSLARFPPASCVAHCLPRHPRHPRPRLHWRWDAPAGRLDQPASPPAPPHALVPPAAFEFTSPRPSLTPRAAHAAPPARPADPETIIEGDAIFLPCKASEKGTNLLDLLYSRNDTRCAPLS